MKKMKTKEKQIEARLVRYRATLKLRVVEHRDLPNAVNSFMIFSGTEANPTAYIVGGNIRTYIPAGRMDKLCYPTVFKSRKSAKEHIETDFWSDQCIKHRVADYEAELRAK